MRIIIVIILTLWCSISIADEPAQPLSAAQAFLFSANYDKNHQLILQWKIAPKYYLYRDRITITKGEGNQIHLGSIALPVGIEKKDKAGGNYQVYAGTTNVIIPFTSNKQDIVDLKIRYQGCSVQGFCYTPITKSLVVTLSSLRPPQDLTPYISGIPSLRASEPSQPEYIQNILVGKNIFIVIVSFLGLGLLLAFTPCVLPMIPILSGIILGHRKKKLNARKTFSLSLAYVIGMAFTYAIAGIIVAHIGSHIQTEFQRPWVIILFSAIFVLLALSLFDVYQLRLPSRLQHRLTTWSNRQKSGTYGGVFLMGCISSLIVSPCITPPLVGVLAYIAQTGDSLMGALALFTLGIGMGVPLLLIGVSAGKLLPKAGPWMIKIERIMGWFMLAFAIWMVSRVIPGPLTLSLWAFWLIGISIFMGAFSRKKIEKFPFKKSVGIVLFIYAIILLIGAGLGNSDPLNPWDKFKYFPVNRYKIENAAVTVTNTKQVEELLSTSKLHKKPIMIDFYADWCESCVRMERYVFNRAEVQRALSRFTVMRVNITHNNAFDQIMMKRFNIIAPPTFVFINSEGRILPRDQIIGEVDASTLLAHLLRIE